MATNLDGIQLVVGIDFGTAYSAYAYSYAYEQDKIFMNSNWPSGSRAWKEMTAILFDENCQFVAFGERAIEKHGELNVDQEKTWHLFSCFKMALYKKKVSLCLTLSLRKNLSNT